MEPTAQEKKRRGLQMSLFSAVGGMVVTFMLGLFVGVHPEWIPVRLASFGNDSSAPTHTAGPAATQGSRGMPQTQPTTNLSK